MNTFIKQLMILSSPLLLVTCSDSGFDALPVMKVNLPEQNNKGSEHLNINKDIKQHVRLRLRQRKMSLKYLQRVHKRTWNLL